jgi:hypothetical protein
MPVSVGHGEMVDSGKQFGWNHKVVVIAGTKPYEL